MASSSIPPSTDYDVFVSFVGEDIRSTFVSHLYRSLEQRGIRAFKDESELMPKPSEIHLAAIQASKIAIVVVSENYLSSRWILKELREILYYKRIGYLTVFPIYYEIDTWDVSMQIEEFKLDLDYVEWKPETAELQDWVYQLVDLLCIESENSSKWKDDAELILKITNDIWDTFRTLRSNGLVGMDLRMLRMYELLSLESKDDQIRKIGIWGRGGLGKKTLARYLYREIYHSFDVHVSLGFLSRFHQEHVPFVLRQKLRSELVHASGGLYTNSSDNTTCLTDQRVLLVVECVETVEQLDILMEETKLFGPGSRVIVICEDKQLLLACGITLLYQVEPLEFYEAHQLLSLCAFKHTDPLIGYEQLFARAIKIGDGCPWVIVVIGSELFGKRKEEWETILSKYERSSDESTVGTEMSDFGVLGDEDNSISRDPASNFVGLDCLLQAVRGLMESEFGDEVRIVGLWGVGGIGKTTLARCLYDETMHYFHTHVFIENVGKIYKDHGPSGSQEELLWKYIQREALEVRNSKNDSDFTKARLRNRKVLLIVDGVENNEQLKDVQKVATWFCEGSRVIVTTRHENLLVANGLKHVYEVKCLKVHEALQLFYCFAFSEQSPFTRFKQLSVRAVQLAGRIPLSLKVLGSFLRGKSGHEWESVLQKLERQQDTTKAEMASIDVGATSNEKPDADNVNVARGSRSVYEQHCIPLWGTVSTCGEKSEMQDAVTALPHFLKIPIKMLMGDHEAMSPSLTHIPAHFFGVYDGHGGSQVAEYCRERIHLTLAEEIERIKEELNKRNTGEGRQAQWEKVFTNCFRSVDYEVAGELRIGSSGEALKVVAPETVGSTAVVALVCSSHIIVSNCGYSRAVLFRGKECISLSVDQKPDRKETAEEVLRWRGARVSGVLPTSKFTGDDYMSPFTRPDPKVTFMSRAREDECLILASDGLWDVVNNQEACEFVRKRILLWHKKNGTLPLIQRGVGEDHACQAAANYLSKLALQRGSKENVSITVVDLKAQRKFKTKS